MNKKELNVALWSIELDIQTYAVLFSVVGKKKFEDILHYFDSGFPFPFRIASETISDCIIASTYDRINYKL